MELQPSDMRLGYRLLIDEPDVEQLSGRLAERFRGAESREVQRVGRMLSYATHEACLAGWLLAYFGEDRAEGCGRCARCRGEGPRIVPAPPEWCSSDGDRSLVASLAGERRSALASPRQMTRFLCGLSSPATTRSKLTKDRRFGALGSAPFIRVLGLVEQVMGGRGS